MRAIITKRVQVSDKHKTLNAKQAASELGVTDEYVRRLATVLHKNKLIDLKASLQSLFARFRFTAVPYFRTVATAKRLRSRSF